MECLTGNCVWNDDNGHCTLSFIEIYGTPNNVNECQDRKMNC